MKPLFAITFVLCLAQARGQMPGQGGNNNNSAVAVFARVDPTGISGNGSGIRGVTSTNLTQDTTAIVRNFFSGGGVGIDPQPNRPAQLATIPPASGAVFVNSAIKKLNEYRGQLAGERLRLVQLIESKRRDRQPFAIETAQVIAIERAIQQADRQMALRGFKDLPTAAPMKNPVQMRTPRATGHR